MPTLIPLDNTMGAAYIGIVLSSIVYGVTWLQVFLYYTKHSARDGRLLKLFVTAVMVLDTLHVALVVLTGYHYAVSNFGDYIAMSVPYWSLVWQAFVGGLVSVLVDSFFAFRVWRFEVSRRTDIPLAIGVVCTAKLACAIGFTIASSNSTSFKQGNVALGWSLGALSTAVLCDSMIAASTIYYLKQGRGGFSSTNRAITLLITYALNTCLLTGIFNAIAMAFWITMDTTLMYALFYFILVRLYSCAFMSILNSRDNVRQELNGRDKEFVTLSHLVAASPQANGMSSSESDNAAVPPKRGVKVGF